MKWSALGPVGWGLGPKPIVPTMPPFSRLGRSFFLDREKRISGICLIWGLAGKDDIWDLIDVGIGEALMQGCSDVRIIREFGSF